MDIALTKHWVDQLSRLTPGENGEADTTSPTAEANGNVPANVKKNIISAQLQTNARCRHAMEEMRDGTRPVDGYGYVLGSGFKPLS